MIIVMTKKRMEKAMSKEKRSCDTCDGKGWIEKIFPAEDDTIHAQEKCSKCSGLGYYMLGDETMRTNETVLREQIASYKGLVEFLSRTWSESGCKVCPARTICKESQKDEILPCHEAIRIWLAQIVE